MRDEREPRYLLSLQVFRGLAALGVVIYHAGLFTERKTGVRLFGGGYHFGELGVDFFFVLSGFIIMFAHGAELGRAECAGRYVWRRFIRVYPLLSILTSAKLMGEILSWQSGRLGPPEMGRVLGSYLLLPIPGGEMPIITAAWTLTHECLFYGLFGLALVFGRRVGAVILIVWMGAVVVAWVTTANLGEIAGWVCDARNVEFAFGILAYLGYQKRRVVPWWIWGAGVVSLGWGVGAYESVLGMDQPLLVRVLLGLGFALLIVCVGCWERGKSHAIWPWWLLWMGEASYSLYLGHSMVVLAVVELGAGVATESLAARYAVAMGASVTAILACGLLWLFVERPLIKWLKSFGR